MCNVECIYFFALNAGLTEGDGGAVGAAAPGGMTILTLSFIEELRC